MSAPLDLLPTAIAHHQAGRLAEAAEMYRAILAQQPANSAAIHLLGVIALQSGQPEKAIELISAAIRIDGGQASFHTNLGEAFRMAGKFADAEACYQQAIKLQPNQPEPYSNLALVHLVQNELMAVVKDCRLATALRPYPINTGKLLASTLDQLGDSDGARAAYEDVLAHAPRDTDALIALARTHRDRDELDQALDYMRRALAQRNDAAGFYTLLGEIQAKQKDQAGAISSFETSLRLEESADVRCYLAMALDAQGDRAAAEDQYRRALETNPAHVIALTCVGVRTQERGDFDLALDFYNRALELAPDAAPAMHNRALVNLTKGNLAAGWAEYDARLKMPRYLTSAIEGPLWDGSDLAGRTLVLVSEQGLGDTLQFVRYVSRLHERGIRPILLVHNAVRPILRESGFDPHDRGPLPPYDCQLPLMSLPRVFGTTLSTIPADLPYLRANDELTTTWRERLQTIEGFKVGIFWKGSALMRADAARSIPLTAFEPLSRISGVQLISLQKFDGLEQLAELKGRFPVLDWGAEADEASGPFMDTAAIMKSLDLVITVDSAAAHLAGGLGVPVWVALSRWPDWRWMLDRDDTPWYPTMRLFRQHTPGDWNELFERIAMRLAGEVASRG